jgi:hypothetical protein
MHPATIEVIWHDGAGFAIYQGAGIRLTRAPPDFVGAIEVHYVDGITSTVRYSDEEQREMTEKEKESLLKRLVAMNCGAFDAWNENSLTLAVVFYKR